MSVHPSILTEESERAIIALCKQHGVERLDLFGSVTGPDFDLDTSDLDFLVTFKPGPRLGFNDRYFQLLSALEELFGRDVDLIEESAIRNPYFRESIEETRQNVFEA